MKDFDKDNSIMRSLMMAMAMLLSTGLTGIGKEIQLGDDLLTRGIPGSGPLSVEEIQEWLENDANHEPIVPVLPLGLASGWGQISGIEENPLTKAKIELGRQLYFDTRLSSDNTISCASCHHPDKGYGFDSQFGIGVEGQEGNRNSPIAYNRILSAAQFWDGRAASLEEQAIGPIANPIEMGNTHDVAMQTIRSIPGYKMQFEAIFGDEKITIEHVGQAIASFERVLVTGPSPYDFQEALAKYEMLDEDQLLDMQEFEPELYAEYVALKDKAALYPMSESAKRGQKLFFSQKTNCSVCHVGANLTDEKYHNLGIGMDVDNPDLGRYEVTKKEEDKGAFKTPTIRNVVYTAPYMHDGSLKTLEEVIDHYVKGGTPNKWLSDKMVPLKLTDQEKKDLLNFMKACTGSFPRVERGRLPANS